MHLKDIAWLGLWFGLGDNKQISSWKDKWSGQPPLRYTFPEVYNLVLEKDASTCDTFQRGHFAYPRIYRGLSDTHKYRKMLRQVHDIQRHRDRTDLPWWEWRKSGRYITICYKAINLSEVTLPFAEGIWSFDIPQKLRYSYGWCTRGHFVPGQSPKRRVARA